MVGIGGIRGGGPGGAMNRPNVGGFQKYSSGLGGGMGSGGIGSNPYAMNYNQNSQGEQGSIGSSGGRGTSEKPNSGVGGKLSLPSVANG